MVDRTAELVNEHKSMFLHEVESRQSTTPDQVRQATRLVQYNQEIDDARAIFIDRNAIYKNTFVYLGLLGTVTTLIGDVFRLRSMIYLNPSHGREYTEQIEDKLIDVINQAVISLMMLHQGNYEGIQHGEE